MAIHPHKDKAPSIPKRTLAALMLLAILINAAYAGTRVALPLYAIQLGASTFTVGTLMAVFTLVPAMLALRLGRLLDRIGPRRPMIIGALGVMIGLCVAAALEHLAALFVSGVLIGTFGGLFFMAHTQAIGRISAPENRTAVFSMSAMAYSASSFLGPMVAGLSIDGFGHAYALLLLATGPLAAVTALQFRWLPVSDTIQRVGNPPARGKVTDFFRTPATRNVYVTGILSNSAWECMNLMTPIYGHSINLSATYIGMVLGAFSVGTFFIRIMLPLMARRLQPWRLLGVAFALATCGFALMPFTTTAPPLIALAFTVGLGLGISQPMVTTLLFETAPAHRIGEALGLRTTMVNVGQTVFPLALGLLGTLLGIAPLYWGVAAMLGGGVVGTQKFAARR